MEGEYCLAKLHYIGNNSEHYGYKRINVNVAVIYTYAPTPAAPLEMQAKFRYDLQDTIDAIPQDDFLMLLRDFNARVGMLGPNEECRWHVVGMGRHGLDKRNEAGEELLLFCVVNQ